MTRMPCQISAQANVTSMGESIFFLLSQQASRIAAGYVTRRVNEALSHWVTSIPALCVQVKEQFYCTTQRQEINVCHLRYA